MRGFSSEATVFCLSSPLFLNSSSSQTQVRGTETWSRRCILPGVADWSWKLHLSEEYFCILSTELCWPCRALELLLLFHLKDHHPASLITGSQQLSILIELDTRNNVRLSHIIVQCPLHLGETPLYVAITCKQFIMSLITPPTRGWTEN